MGKRKFDRAMLETETGIRAIWLLYKRGRWGALEDFGMDRSLAEPAFRVFERHETIVGRPTKRQCKLLVSTVPGLREAGRELRLAYAMKHYDADKKGRA